MASHGVRVRLRVLALVAALASCCSNVGLRRSLAQPIAKSQGAVLQDLQPVLMSNFTGWRTGSDCKQAEGLTCDKHGMITAMRFATYQTNITVDSVTRLSRLIELEINDATYPPEGSLYSITWLKSFSLDCSRNTAYSIPAEMGNLTQLTRLRIRNCPLGDETATLSRLTTLVDLELLSNGHYTLWNLAQTTFPTLMKLDVSNLVRSNLARSNLVRSNLVRSNLGRSSLARSNLGRSNLVRSNLVRSNLVRSILVRSNLVRSNLVRSNLVRSNLVRSNLVRSNLVRSNLVRSNLVRSNFVRCNLVRSNLVRSNLATLDLDSIVHLTAGNTVGVFPVGSKHSCLVVSHPPTCCRDLRSNLLTLDSIAYLKNLTALTWLDMSSNQLRGDRLAEGNLSLPNLQYMNLSNNQLTGGIPESFTTMTALVGLNVSFNYMDGTIPPSLGSLKNLSTISTNGTSLTCPASYSSCGVPQNETSGFCRTCSDFCTTCGRSVPAAPTASDTPQSALSTGAIVAIVVAAAAGVVALAALLYCCCFTRKQQKALMSSKAASQVCQEYPLHLVVKATNGWSEANLLGAGAFGDVYRAVSPADCATLWAVKRAKIITNDFDTEVCQMATKHHPNLVRLLGFSIGITDKTRVEQILIYELMPHGDLSQWIGQGAAVPLSFQQRVDILMGAARGFEYLHSFGIVHRDIKPANILLDHNMQAKISDFGLVRKGEGTTVQSTRVVGTPGYVDPSYVASKKAISATDVYSFGILILELMTGRQVVETPLAGMCDEETPQPINILPWVQQQLSHQSGDTGLPLGLKDPCMEARDDLVLAVLQLALRCTAKHSASRPAMGAIAAELEVVMVELGGSRSNAAALQVDRQVQAGSARVTDMNDDIAQLNALFAGSHKYTALS
ncbi:hypothetical protein CLOM_g14471 [Closterium sp. NIES-68]|nr:hypothetical protein CLOM_g14471 [Closterium sp. NIES-68]GJP81484.1 hypothetical protein CLOP_g11633 [Closterium sp. NIES-67]